MSRCINTLAAIVGSIAASVSALVGLAQLGLIDLDRPASIVMDLFPDEDPDGFGRGFEDIPGSDSSMSVVRTRITTSHGPERLPGGDLSPRLDDLLETIESMRRLQDRLFRPRRGNAEDDDERR